MEGMAYVIQLIFSYPFLPDMRLLKCVANKPRSRYIRSSERHVTPRLRRLLLNSPPSLHFAFHRMRMHGGTPRLRLLTAKVIPVRHIPIPNFLRGVHAQTAPQWTTTVAKGTAFEHRSLQILAQDLAMDLHRVGGKDDGGVDLIGWWKLPHFPSNPTAATLPE